MWVHRGSVLGTTLRILLRHLVLFLCAVFEPLDRQPHGLFIHRVHVIIILYVKQFASKILLVFTFSFFTLHSDAMEERKYNLRSGRSQEHVIPIQLQMASDADFISQSLGSSHPMPKQVF